MEIQRLQDLLAKAKTLRRAPVEKNIFTLGSRGYYENPTSDLLKFFLDPQEEHGLKDLFLSSFVELVIGTPALLELETSPEREYLTKNGARIDIVLRTSDWIIVVENKIRHDPLNDFDEYRDTVKERFSRKAQYFAILSPTKIHIDENWKPVTYDNLIANVRSKLGVHFFESGISKWGILLREFLLNLEEEVKLSIPMIDDERYNLIKSNYADVAELIDLHTAYIDRLKTDVEKLGADVLGAAPAIVIPRQWPEGMTLQLYPKKDRVHKAVLLLKRAGGFTVQIYVQWDKRRPPDADQLVFTANGKFKDMDWDKERGARVRFFRRDESEFGGALDAVRASLQVLRDNTE
jgi:PD-(D/E)XK nuclease superfamily